MEPGTFKDRLLMEGDPHLLLEGIIIGSFAIQADTAYIFLRGEYKVAEQRLKKQFRKLTIKDCLGKIF